MLRVRRLWLALLLVLVAGCTASGPDDPVPSHSGVEPPPPTLVPASPTAPRPAVTPTPPGLRYEPRMLVQDAEGRILWLEADGSVAEVAQTDLILRPAGRADARLMDGPIAYTFAENRPGRLVVVDTAVGQILRQEFMDAGGSPLALRALTEEPAALPHILLSLAWSEIPAGMPQTMRLMISAPDGSGPIVAFEENFEGEPAVSYTPWQWSPDGNLLYFTRDPRPPVDGPFPAGGSLWLYDLLTGEARHLFSPENDGSPCLDALSSNGRLLVHHCDPEGLTLLDLESGQTRQSVFPPDVGPAARVGTVRISPDGRRIALTLLPDGDDTSRIAVGSVTGGPLETVATAEPGAPLEVVRWLDDTRLLLQATGATPTLWMAGADGSGLTHLAAATYLADGIPRLPPPQETPAPAGEEFVVNQIALAILESFPVQVHATLDLTLPDACSFVERVEESRDGSTITLVLTIARHPNQRCAPQPTPFAEIVPLDVAGLPAGAYTVQAHGTTATFTLQIDNAPP